MAINITCLMTFFASTTLSQDRWDLCEEDPHCLCGKSGLTDPMCAPPDVVETYCGENNTTSRVIQKNAFFHFIFLQIILKRSLRFFYSTFIFLYKLLFFKTASTMTATAADSFPILTVVGFVVSVLFAVLTYIQMNRFKRSVRVIIY